MDIKKDLEKCISDFMDQGHSREEAEMKCSEQDKSKEKEHTSFPEKGKK